MMRHIITFKRICVAGFRNFFRNSWLSIAATAVMVVALVIVLSAVVLNVATRNAIAELSTNLKVSVYLQPNASKEQINELQNELSGNQNVDQVTFISQDLAQEQFIDSFKNDTKLLEGLALIGTGTIPASFEISVKDLSKMEEVGNIAKQEQYTVIVESVSLGKTDVKKTIERAAATQRFITTTSIIAASVFAIVSMLIIFNTIRMAIFTRADEIRTQKLLGATPGYIRGPFLVESSMYGIVAGIISTSLVIVVIRSLGSKIANNAEFIETYAILSDPLNIVLMYLGSIILGMLVGIISSSLAMNRYLKIKHW